LAGRGRNALIRRALELYELFVIDLLCGVIGVWGGVVEAWVWI
jgi:hypothetical protein